MNTSSTKFGLPESALDQMHLVFSSHPEVAQVVLYGSRAKGDFRPGSDIDLTILGDAVTWQQFQIIEQELDDLLLPYKLDLSLYHHIDNQNLKDHIQRVGQVFYRRDGASQGEM